jgi:hypothetical protein
MKPLMTPARRFRTPSNDVGGAGTFAGVEVLMSDSMLRFIPRQPAYAPPLERRQAAVSRLRDAFSDADDVSARETEEVTFIDAGGNFESVFCPLCNKKLEQEWWLEAMDRAFSTAFEDLAVKLPCCGGSTTLNDLRYEWPQGFARFVLEVANPGVNTISDALVAEVGTIIGCDVRVVWAHY